MRAASALKASGVVALAMAALAAAPDVSTARAQTAPPPPKPSPTPPARKPETSVASIASSIAKSLDRLPSRVLVVAAPIASDVQAPRAAELASLFAAQIAGRLGKNARAKSEAMSLANARAAAKNDDALVYIAVRIAQGKARATVDVFPVPKTVWLRARAPEPGPVAHAFAEAPLDAELRSYLAPIPLTAANVARARNFEGDVVALACGDLDGDGALEIVSVSRRRVSTLRLRDGKVVVLASRNWPDLAPLAPAPLREPIAFATIAKRGDASLLDVGLTDRDKSVRLDGKLALVASSPLLAIPDGDGTACAKILDFVVSGPLAPCTPNDPPPFAASVGGRYDAFASAALVSPSGAPFVVWAGRESRKLEVADDEHGRFVSNEIVGAQLAVGDLDQDGAPDVVASLDTDDPRTDAIVVRSFARDPKETPRLRETMRLPAAAGVRALAVCPPDGPGRAPFVVATADEIWVVR